MSILSIRQYRMRNATIDEAEAFLVEFGKKAAVQAREAHAWNLAHLMTHNIDSVALGMETQAPSLDAVWSDLHEEMVKASTDPVETITPSARVVFDIYPLRGDVLLQNALDHMRYRHLWNTETRIERYGKAVIPYDKAEYDRRVADWSSVREGRRVVAFDGIVERPDFEAIRARVPDLDRRASSFAFSEVDQREVARLLRLDFEPEEVTTAMIRASEYLDTQEGAAEVEKARLEILKKLPPEITDEMLINGMAATPARAS